MNKEGNSLIQVLVGAFISAILIGGSVMLYRNIDSKSKTATTKSNVESNLLEAEKFVRRLGRMAQSCARVEPTPGNAELHCNVNFNTPSSAGSSTWIRFLINAGALDYQKCTGTYDVAKNLCSTPGGWASLLSYQHVTSFLVCDTAMIASETCPIKPDGLGLLRKAKITPDDSHFFRYALVAETYALSSNPDAKSAQLAVRSALYLRNSAVRGSDLGAGTLYQW